MSFIVSPQARLDLIEIWNYIANNNIDAADRLIERFNEAFLKLSGVPDMGHKRQDLLGQSPFYFWTVGNYQIIYVKAKNSGKGIEIARVLSRYRDISALLE